MNRRQQERVADLGRAFQEALTDIINMGDEAGMEEPMEMVEPMPIPVDMNSGLATHPVYVRHVHNGFIVEVGCQTFVFETFDKMAKYMKMYYEDPQGTCEKHYKGELLK